MWPDYQRKLQQTILRLQSLVPYCKSTQNRINELEQELSNLRSKPDFLSQPIKQIDLPKKYSEVDAIDGTIPMVFNRTSRSLFKGSKHSSEALLVAHLISQLPPYLLTDQVVGNTIYGACERLLHYGKHEEVTSLKEQLVATDTAWREKYSQLLDRYINLTEGIINDSARTTL